MAGGSPRSITPSAEPLFPLDTGGPHHFVEHDARRHRHVERVHAVVHRDPHPACAARHGVDSLNVAVAAGIVLYEVTRPPGIKWE